MSEDRASAGRVLLGAALRKYRMESGLTLSEVAQRANLSLSYLSEAERGRKLMSLEALDAWAVAMDVTVVDVLAGVYPFGSASKPRRVEPVVDGRFRQES
jgi:transcriptional regulator with XRE-family HTH domain